MNDPIAYSGMTSNVGAPVDGLMARGGPLIEHRPVTNFTSCTNSY